MNPTDEERQKQEYEEHMKRQQQQRREADLADEEEARRYNDELDARRMNQQRTAWDGSQWNEDIVVSMKILFKSFPTLYGFFFRFRGPTFYYAGWSLSEAMLLPINYIWFINRE